MKIFISYSSKDDKILHSFVDKILILGLLIKRSDINCAGIESCKPKSGKNFKEWIKNGIESADVIIQLISSNYKNSEVCQNELGASWLTKAKIFPFLIAPVNFYNVGFIHNTSQSLKINSKRDLLKFSDEVQSLLKLEKPSMEALDKQVSSFINELSKEAEFINKRVIVKSEIGFSTDFEFFDEFLKPNVSVKSLILKAQPTIADCMLILRKEYYLNTYKIYSELFQKADFEEDYSQYEEVEMDSANFKQLKSDKHGFPSGMTDLAKNFIIKSNVRLYTVRFKMKGETSGMSLKVWAYLNNRWIFFPRLNAFVDDLKTLNNLGS